MKTIELNGPDVRRAIGAYVLEKHPEAIGATLSGPFQVMVILGMQTTIVTVDLDFGPPQVTRASTDGEEEQAKE